MSIKDLSQKLQDDIKTILEGGTVVVEDASNDKSDDGEGLDKADPKAAKKKFKDRKDKDIDNDGDVDSSDEFLHKRRKAISKKVDEDSSVEIDKDDEEDDDVVKKPEDDEKSKQLLKDKKLKEKVLYKSPTGWSFEKFGGNILVIGPGTGMGKSRMEIDPKDFKVLQRIIGMVKV
mgnify:CR=1 FL=1